MIHKYDLLLFSMIISCSQAAGQEVISEFTTLTRVYKGVTISVVEPDGIRIQHETGVAKIAYDDLTPEQRAKYGLNEEKRNAYLQKIREQQERLIASNKAKLLQSQDQSISGQPSARNQENPAATDSGARYVTPQQMKIYWYHQLPKANRMHANYALYEQARSKFVEDVRAGKYDLLAQKAAVRYNRNEAEKFGDAGKAKMYEAELYRIEDMELQIQKIEASKREAQALDQLSVETARLRQSTEEQTRQMDSLRRKLDQLNLDFEQIHAGSWK